jgi:hypothetical protein
MSQIDFAKYSIDLGVGKFDLVPIMDGQPLTLLAQTRDGADVLFRFELWHQRLLPAAHAHRVPDAVTIREPYRPKGGGSGRSEGGGGGGGFTNDELRVRRRGADGSERISVENSDEESEGRSRSGDESN